MLPVVVGSLVQSSQGQTVSGSPSLLKVYSKYGERNATKKNRKPFALLVKYKTITRVGTQPYKIKCLHSFWSGPGVRRGSSEPTDSQAVANQLFPIFHPSTKPCPIYKFDMKDHGGILHHRSRAVGRSPVGRPAHLRLSLRQPRPTGTSKQHKSK